MSSGQKPMVGARVDYSWKDQIEKICRESGKTESEVVREAIAAYLGKTNVESVMSMNQRIKALERKYQKLAEIVVS
jgi:RHH-type rel operon transcriptional repressor/antitoxin RelB